MCSASPIGSLNMDACPRTRITSSATITKGPWEWAWQQGQEEEEAGVRDSEEPSEFVWFGLERKEETALSSARAGTAEARGRSTLLVTSGV